MLIISDNKIKIIDFGSACYSGHQVFPYIQSRFYRAPEVILGIQYDTAIDIWSLGCIAFELYFGVPLFPGASEYDQIRMIVSVCGLPDIKLLCKGNKSDQFFNFSYNNAICALKSKEQYELERKAPVSLREKSVKLDSLDDIYNASKEKGKKEDKFDTNIVSFIHFLKCALMLDPNLRWTAKMLLMHPFIRDADMIELSLPQIESIRKESIDTSSSFENPNLHQESCPTYIAKSTNNSQILNNVDISYRPELSLLSSDYFKGFIYGRLDQVLNSSELSVIEHIKLNPELHKLIEKQKHVFDPNSTKTTQGAYNRNEKYSSYDPQYQQMYMGYYQTANAAMPSVLPQNNISYIYPSHYQAQMMAQQVCMPMYNYSTNPWYPIDKTQFTQFKPEYFYNMPSAYNANDESEQKDERKDEEEPMVCETQQNYKGRKISEDLLQKDMTEQSQIESNRRRSNSEAEKVIKDKRKRSVKSSKRRKKKYEVVYTKKSTKPPEKGIHISTNTHERNPYVKAQLPSKGPFLEKIAATAEIKKKTSGEKWPV